MPRDGEFSAAPGVVEGAIDAAAFRADWLAGVPVRDMARRYGMSWNAVSVRVDLMGLPRRPSAARAANVLADPAMARAIRKAWREEPSLNAMSRRLGLGARMLRRCLDRLGLGRPAGAPDRPGRAAPSLAKLPAPRPGLPEPGHGFWTPARDNRIRDTIGVEVYAYRLGAALAAEWRVSEHAVRARWHLLRRR